MSRVEGDAGTPVLLNDGPAPCSSGRSSLAVATYKPQTRHWALVAFVVASLIAAAIVAAPLWVAILIGVVMAISTQRAYAALVRRMGEKRSSWAAGIVTLATGFGVALAGALVLFTLANELMKLVAHLDQPDATRSLSGLIGERGANAISGLGINTERLYGWARTELEAAASYTAALAAVVLRTTSYAVLGLVVSLMTMYYVLLEGPRLARRIECVAPLEPRHTRALLREAREVGRTAFIGTLGTAFIQGALAGLGYSLLGVPQPIAWAVATALASFIPVIGTALVWVPVSGWLIIEGHPIRAVILIVYGLVIITSLADYVIRPRMVGGHGHGHPLLMLISLLGGIEVFGLAGLIVAPILMSVFVAAFRIYEREVCPSRSAQTASS